MIASKPGLQLDQRDVGFLRHLCAQRLVVSRKLRLRPAARPVGRHVAARPAPAKRFVNVRHADPKQRRGRIDAQPAVHRRHHPIPKVLRISNAHKCFPAPIRLAQRITSPSQTESPDSARPENALARLLIATGLEPWRKWKGRAWSARPQSKLPRRRAPSGLRLRLEPTGLGTNRPRLAGRGDCRARSGRGLPVGR